VAEQKTKPTRKSVEKFLDSVEDEQMRKDCYAISKMMQQVTKAEPKMWGDSIVGFGSYHYKYASGHEGDSCLTGFAPRKGKISVYVMSGFEDYDELLKDLGKFKKAKACLYIKRLDDVDQATLKKLVAASVRYVKKQYA